MPSRQLALRTPWLHELRPRRTREEFLEVFYPPGNLRVIAGVAWDQLETGFLVGLAGLHPDDRLVDLLDSSPATRDSLDLVELVMGIEEEFETEATVDLTFGGLVHGRAEKNRRRRNQSPP